MLGFAIGELDVHAPTRRGVGESLGGNGDGGGLFIGNEGDFRRGAGADGDPCRPGGFEGGAVTSVGAGGVGGGGDSHGNVEIFAAAEGGTAFQLGRQRAPGRLIDEGDEAELGGGGDEGGERAFERGFAGHDQAFDRFAGGPAAVLDAAVIEPPGGGGLDFEKFAIGFEFGEILFFAGETGFGGFEGDFLEREFARKFHLGGREGEGCFGFAGGKGFRFAGDEDLEGAFVVEGFHPEPVVSAGDGIPLPDEDDFLGFLGEVIGVVHFGELFEFLLGVFEILLGAFEGLVSAFFGGLAAGLDEIRLLFPGVAGGAADRLELERGGRRQVFEIQFGLGEAEFAGGEGAAGVGKLLIDVFSVEFDQHVTGGDLAAMAGELGDFEIRPSLGIKADEGGRGGQGGGAERLRGEKRLGFDGEFAGAGGGGEQDGEEQ